MLTRVCPAPPPQSGFRDFLDHCECLDMDYDTILNSRPGRLPPGKEAGGKVRSCCAAQCPKG
jgi:hypothetical protein